MDVAALARTLAFTVRLPDPAVAGHPVAAAIDRAVPSGLIEITYDEFTLVELASSDGASPVIDKRVGAGTTVTPVTVGTRPGLWLAGEPHEVAIVDPDGELVHDSVRRAGNVLVWEDGGVTYRIEGLASLERALDIAVSLR